MLALDHVALVFIGEPKILKGAGFVVLLAKSASHVVVEHRVGRLLFDPVFKDGHRFFDVAGDAVRDRQIIYQYQPKILLQFALFFLKLERFFIETVSPSCIRRPCTGGSTPPDSRRTSWCAKRRANKPPLK